MGNDWHALARAQHAAPLHGFARVGGVARRLARAGLLNRSCENVETPAGQKIQFAQIGDHEAVFMIERSPDHCRILQSGPPWHAKLRYRLPGASRAEG